MKQYSMRKPQLVNWLGGIALGAMAMYLADPAQGKRRRLLVQDKMRTASSRAGTTLGQVVHRAGNRLAAVQSRVENPLKRKVMDDRNIQDRVRSTVHKLTGFPEQISIKAEQGCVTLSGLVDAKEKNRLFHALQRIPGVRGLRDHLETRVADRGRWLRKEGRPDPETGAGVAMLSAMRRFPITPLLAVAGLGYAIQSLGKVNLQRSKSSTASSRRDVIHLQKSIEIQASPETVFNIWSNYHNFPQFMSRLVEIQNHGTQHSHWLMEGPGGVNLEWDAVLTKYLEPSMFAWKTEPGAPIEHNGSVRFESANGGTRATVRMFYGPGPGRRSDSLAPILGDDPEQELEADLQRMKNFIEGKSYPRDMPPMTSSSGQVLH